MDKKEMDYAVLLMSTLQEIVDRYEIAAQIANIIRLRKTRVVEAMEGVSDLFEDDQHRCKFLLGLKKESVINGPISQVFFREYCTDFNGEWSIGDYRRVFDAVYSLYFSSEVEIRKIEGVYDEE